MEKQKYYVSVGSGEILSDPTATSYQFEIEATPAEVARLNALFERANSAANDGFFRFRDYEWSKNQNYDQTLSSIYQTIHDLGDETAREHIESMDILH
ncbi:MAG TPA: hypothetical protein VFT51_01015 [Bacillales bacterium]|nr:hypothetical protein [Bacillales bacterium]